MPGFLLNMSCVVQCAHGGRATPTTPNPRVMLSGTPALMAMAPFIVTGCAMTGATPAGPAPAPCISGTFLPPTMTTRVKSMGQPMLVQTSTGLSVTTPPAPPAPLQVVSAGQGRVRGA
jgi:hypothetical protein